MPSDKGHVVTMPDGQLVEMPDTLTPEQQQRLQEVVSKGNDLSKGGEEKPRTLKEDIGFVTGNVNKALASVAGGAVDTANLVPRLAAATAAGHPSYAFDDPSAPVGGSQWFESLMKQHGMITKSAQPRNTTEKMLAGAIQGTTLALGGVGAGKATEEVVNVAKNIIERPPKVGIVKTPSQTEVLAKDLRKEGYVFSPAQVRPGLRHTTLEGFAGKPETLQEASVRNQTVTNKLGRQDLGVSVNTPLNNATLDLVRGEAYGTYNKVRALPGTFELGTAYIKDISELNSEFAALESKFPGLTKSPEIEEFKKILTNPKALEEGVTPSEAVDLSRVLRKKATDHYKLAMAKDGNPEQLALAQAERDAAKSVEDVISRGIKRSQFPSLYDDWTAARKKLAVSYDVEAALNPDTGNIAASKVAALARKGRPLTDGMEKIAKFARSFERTAQSPEKIGGVTGGRLDMILATTGGVIGHTKGGVVGSAMGAAAGAEARPILRRALLSKPYQDYITGVSKDKVARRIEQVLGKKKKKFEK